MEEEKRTHGHDAQNIHPQPFGQTSEQKTACQPFCSSHRSGTGFLGELHPSPVVSWSVRSARAAQISPAYVPVHLLVVLSEPLPAIKQHSFTLCTKQWKQRWRKGREKEREERERERERDREGGRKGGGGGKRGRERECSSILFQWLVNH